MSDNRLPILFIAHPREDHPLPLMVAAGAAGDNSGEPLLPGKALGVAMASYRFG